MVSILTKLSSAFASRGIASSPGCSGLWLSRSGAGALQQIMMSPLPVRAAILLVNFFVAQNQKYEGDNWWKWSLWIGGSDEDLDQIESVTYRLHSTFPQPVRKVTDRASKFQLRCSGWGVFLIPVEVRLKTGKAIQLLHQLQFTFPENASE